MEKERKEETGKEKEEKKSDIKEKLKKAWNFLWKEESLASYIAFIIVSFLVLKFLVFPAMLYFSGLSDISAVVSNSMEHNDNLKYTFYNWLDFNNFSKEEVEKWPWQEGLNIGDVVLIKKVPPEEIKVGDVILFKTPYGDIIHRVVFIKEINGSYYYTTKGDNNGMIGDIEKDIPYENIKGKLVGKVPYLGYPKYILSLFLPR